VLVVFLSFVVLLLTEQWRQVQPLLSRLSVWVILEATIAVLLGHLAIFLSWRAVLNDLGSPLLLMDGLRIFFLGQLGKYVPGLAWPAITQMELGRDYRVPRRVSTAVVATTLFISLGTGLLVATSLRLLVGSGALGRYRNIVLALPVVALLAAPPVLNRLLGLGLRLVRRAPLPRSLSLAGALRSAGWALVAWLFYGGQIWLLAKHIGEAGGVQLLLQSTGAFAAAWCVGFLLIVAPAGVGARDVALILLLESSMSRPQATAVAIVSRLLFIAADLGCGTAIALARHRARVSRWRSA
jgi:hypothetical protein